MPLDEKEEEVDQVEDRTLSLPIKDNCSVVYAVNFFLISSSQFLSFNFPFSNFKLSPAAIVCFHSYF